MSSDKSDKKMKKSKKDEEKKEKKKEKKEKKEKKTTENNQSEEMESKSKKRLASASVETSKEQKKAKCSDSAETYRKEHQISTNGDIPLPDPIQNFDDAPFNEKIKHALTAAGYTKPSPIQAQGWPVALSGSDLVAVAKTGSGKTLGFLMPALHMFDRGDFKPAGGSGPVVLVLAPTRELVQQIHEECLKFQGKVNNYAGATCIFGGVPKGPQVAELRNHPSVVTATPGRMVDLMDMKAIQIANVRFLVLDEGDRMLDMGFEPQIKRILGEIPPQSRQTLFFTATWNKTVQSLATKYLQPGSENKMVNITVGSTEELVANAAISQLFHSLDDSEKDEKLWKLLDELPDGSKVVTFANTKRRIDHLAKACWDFGFGASAIHGDKSQQERNAALAKFQDGEWPLMFATDVAARGLDIQGVTHVVNYDMPRDVENYIHRIGRTGRAGKSGTSITFWNKAYDIPCAPALAKIAREAGCEVPSWLDDWVKKAASGKKNKAWIY